MDHAFDRAPPAPDGPAPVDWVQMMRRSADARRSQSDDMRAGLMAVQRAGPGAGSEGVHAAAARGIAGPGQTLPHAEPIQASFGHHDVGGIEAHVGGPAAEATRAMGASAYATGNAVAFESDPDLHTAAHEAAHVVQQREGVSLKGGVGEAGDRYEQHADAVADRVVAGRSAADLLDAGPGGGGGGAAVQRSEGEGDSDEKDEPWWRLTPEVTLKPPLVTGFNDGPEARLSIDPAGAVSGSITVEGAIDKKKSTSWEVGNPPFLAKVLVGGEFGVKAKGGVKITGTIKKHEDAPEKDYAELKFAPTGTVEFFASGKLAGGPAIGVPDVGNASVMAYGQLEAKLEAGVQVEGGVRWGKDGLKGVMGLPFDLKSTITASGGILVVAEFLSKDVELAEIKLAELDVARAGVKASPTVTFPGGAISGDTPEITEPEFVLTAQPKVQKLKGGALKSAVAKAQKIAEQKIAEMETAQARAEAEYQAARTQRAADLGLPPGELRPEHEVCPLPGEDPVSSEPGPNASMPEPSANPSGPNASEPGPNRSQQSPDA